MQCNSSWCVREDDWKYVLGGSIMSKYTLMERSVGWTMLGSWCTLLKLGARPHRAGRFFHGLPPQMELFRQRPHTDALSKKSNEDLPRNQELEMWQILRNAGVWPVAGGVGYFTARFVDKDSFTRGMPWSRPTAATEGECTWASALVLGGLYLDLEDCACTWRTVLRLGGLSKKTSVTLRSRNMLVVDIWTNIWSTLVTTLSLEPLTSWLYYSLIIIIGIHIW